MKKMWKQINKIAQKNSSKESMIKIRSVNIIETDPVTIENNFNNFFTATANKLTENI